MEKQKYAVPEVDVINLVSEGHILEGSNGKESQDVVWE